MNSEGTIQEFRDGSSGPIEPAQRLFRRLADESIENGKAVHLRTVQELERLRTRAQPGGNSMRKSRKDARRRLDRIERKLKELETRLNAATADSYHEGIRVYPASALERLDPEKCSTRRTKWSSLITRAARAGSSAAIPHGISGS